MGYELWTSPETGYRRRGTRASEFRALFEKGLTVASIYEPLRCCSLGDEIGDVRVELDYLEFDVAGVLDPRASRVIGWVERSALTEGCLADHLMAIEADQLVSDSTPLIDVLQLLAARRWALVVAGPGVNGIVTRADLQKPPMRALLFGHLSLLEMHLTYWIEQQYPDDGWREVLAPRRVMKAEQLLQLRQDRNEEISLVHCLQLCDKRDLVARSEALRGVFGFANKAEARGFLKAVEGLRDRVAHSQDDLAEGTDWRSIAATMNGVQRLLERSDAEVEARNPGKRAASLVPAP